MRDRKRGIIANNYPKNKLIRALPYVKMKKLACTKYISLSNCTQ
jgi:hypothetical protein